MLFVRTSRYITFEFSSGTDCPSIFCFVFSRRQPPLRSDHATVHAYDHVCRILLKQQSEIDVYGSRCLATTMRSSIHCMLLVRQKGRSACDIVGPRATARNATHIKASKHNKAYIALFFLILHK